MKKIAILGCENSHANKFLNYVIKESLYPDIEIAGVWSDEPDAVKKLVDEYGVYAMTSPDEFVGKIDGLVITARRGSDHYRLAAPYIPTGIPMFIDKPITIGEEEAVCFMRHLMENNIRITGGSSLKQDEFICRLKQEAIDKAGGNTIGGYVRAPYQRVNEYGGFYFYAQHLVEMVCEIFGRFPISVLAKENGKQIHVLFHYPDYDCIGLLCDENYNYYASRMSETASSSYPIPSSNEWFYKEFLEFYELLCGGDSAVSYDEFISPVFIMNAIARSLESGKEETINPISI